MANQNEVTKLFENLSKAVDRFHFPVHKRTDKYCQENCNPNREFKKLNIDKMNTPACEQAFKWLNDYKNLKTMNEPRFKFYLLYLIDLHNLHLENRISVVANPLNIKRMFVKETSSDGGILSESEASDKEPIENLMKEFNKCINLVEKYEVFEDCFTVNEDGQMKCKFCLGIYKREGHLRNHLENKHNNLFKLMCSVCGGSFPDSSRLVRHKKSCA